MAHPIHLCPLRWLAAGLLIFLLTPGAAAAPAGATFRGDPQAIQEVKAAYEKFGSARTWRARLSAQGATQTIEFVAPDRFRMVLTGDGQTSEIVSIGSEQWLRSGGTCYKPPTTIKMANPREHIDHPGDAVITVARGGRENVDGTATQTYTVTVQSGGTTTQQKLYVAIATGYPRRIEVQSPQGTMRVDYFDFNAAFTIAPPC